MGGGKYTGMLAERHCALIVLRNSGEIEQIADSIAMVYRPEQYGELSDPVTRESFYHVGRFFVIKNRNGGTGEVRFRYNDSLTQIYPYKK